MAYFSDAAIPAKVDKTSYVIGVPAGSPGARQKWPVRAVFGRSKWLNAHGEVWQNHITKSVANPANNTFTADRFRILFDVDGGTPPTTLTHYSHEATATEDAAYAVTTTGTGSGYGANSYYLAAQRILHGTQEMSNGDYVTLALEAWTTTGSTKKLGVGCLQNYGTGGSPSSEETLPGGYVTISPTPSWYSVTIQTNSLSGKTMGTDQNSYLESQLWYQWGATAGAKVGDTVAETWGTANDIHISDLMFYNNDSSGIIKPYVNRSETEELIELLPYCEVIHPAASGYGTISPGFAEDSTSAFGMLTYSPKVFVPTITETLPMEFRSRGGSVYAASAMTFSDITRSRCEVDMTLASSALAGRAGILRLGNSSKIVISAEDF